MIIFFTGLHLNVRVKPLKQHCYIFATCATATGKASIKPGKTLLSGKHSLGWCLLEPLHSRLGPQQIQQKKSK